MQVRAHLGARQGWRGSGRLHKLSLPSAVLVAELGFNQRAPENVSVRAQCVTPSAACPRARPSVRLSEGNLRAREVSGTLEQNVAAEGFNAHGAIKRDGFQVDTAFRLTSSMDFWKFGARPPT